MKIITDILYFELFDLTDLGVAESTITQGIYRNSSSWVSIKDPADKRKVLIQYETLSDQYKQHFITKYGNPYQYLIIQKQQMQQTQLSQSIAALPTNINPTSKDVVHFQTEHSVTDYEAQQLARACAWLSFYLNVRTKDQLRAVGFESKDQLLQSILDHVTAEGLKCLNIKNLRVLKRKITTFKNEGKDSLVSKKKGNKNAGKLCEVSKALLRKIYREHNAFPITHVVFQYNTIALDKGLATISESTAKAYLAQPDVQMATLRQRYGADYRRHNLELVMSRKKPSHPNAMWVMDGTPIELFYKEPGKPHPLRVYGFMVVDCFSWKIVGFSLGKTETQQLVFQAIKDACIKTTSLPTQLQYDNSSAIKSNDMVEWYKMLCIYSTPAAVGNARTKIIEPLLGHFRNQILRYAHNHSGGNITAKSQDSRVNQEWLKDHPETMPTRQQAIHQIEVAVEAWNSRVMTDGLSPNQKYKKPNPRPRVLEFMDTINLFWKFRMDGSGKKKELKYTTNGLTMTINKEKHTYMVYDAGGQPDTEFHLDHLNDKFQVKYDSEDLEMIYLYKNDKPIHMAQLKRETPMAIVDYKEDDAEYIQGFVKRRKEIFQEVEDRNDYDDAMLEELVLVDAESYIKAPIPMDGSKYKDATNHAQDIIKGGKGSIYRGRNNEQEGGLA